VVLVLSSAYLLVGILGLILMDTSANFLAINQADNVLHLAGGALGIGVVAASARRGARLRVCDSPNGPSGDEVRVGLYPPSLKRPRLTPPLRCR
jgi:Domain of unknown function (DUF4383)